MLAVLSPAKRLDFESPAPANMQALPRFLGEAKELAQTGAKLEAGRIQAMMDLSDALAQKTLARFKAYDPEFEAGDAKPALYAFQGDVYQGLDAASLNKPALNHAQKHLRILSGLYGLLRPMDMMQAYRLEMGTKFPTGGSADLYDFWGGKISQALNDDMAEVGAETLVNLASQEYFKAVDKKVLNAPVLTIEFREMRDGEPKIISFFAKKARGTMARYIADNQITDPEDLKDFDRDNYRFRADLSDEKKWVFLRPDSRDR